MNDMKIKIGVMGSASGPTIRDPKSIDKALRLGQAIAEKEIQNTLAIRQVL